MTINRLDTSSSDAIKDRPRQMSAQRKKKERQPTPIESCARCVFATSAGLQQIFLGAWRADAQDQRCIVLFGSQLFREQNESFVAQASAKSCAGLGIQDATGVQGPLRAIAKPHRIRSSSAIECASGLMLNMQPSSSPR
jgi:hypothetical protein